MYKINFKGSRENAQFVKVLLANFVGTGNYEVRESRKVGVNGTVINMDITIRGNFRIFSERLAKQNINLQFVCQNAGTWNYAII